MVKAQTPAPLVDISKYHNDNRVKEMIDNNFSNITDGGYTIPILKTDSITAGAVNYSDTYYDDLRVPLTNTRINPANSEPDFEDRGDGLFAWGFDADSDSTYVLNFIAQTPHKRKDNTDLDAHIHWQPDGTNTGDVVWKIMYSVAAVNGEWSAVDSFRVADAADGTAYKHQLTELGIIDGSSLGISSMIVGSISRVGNGTDDTYTGVVYGLEIDFHYEIDSPGSIEEYEK